MPKNFQPKNSEEFTHHALLFVTFWSIVILFYCNINLWSLRFSGGKSSFTKVRGMISTLFPTYYHREGIF